MTEAEIRVVLDRLMKVESSAPAYHVGPTTNWHRNPDGPEAAAVIQGLVARIAELEGLIVTHEICAEKMLARIERAGAFCGSVLAAPRSGEASPDAIVRLRSEARSLFSETAQKPASHGEGGA